MYRFLVILFLSCSFFVPKKGLAQIFPPELLCISNDTLLWDLPINNCGPFEAYEIYRSPNANGPFSLVIRITDPNQTTYFDQNLSAQIRYYYMLADFNCSGSQQISSDTIDNQFPEITTISSLSVAGTNVEISWPVSNSPEVRSYIIYRRTPSGVTPIDTVVGATSYIDTSADPLLRSETYFVLAMDRCLRTSLFDNPQSTILLDSEVSVCEQSITLSWNPYENWTGGTERQEVWLSINGDMAQPVATIGALASTYTYTGADDNQTYCFFIRAYNAASSAFANSSESCLTLDIVQPIRNLQLKNISVNAMNDVSIDWCWNTDAEINTSRVLQSEEAIGEFSVINSEVINFPLQLNNSFQEMASSAGLAQQFYRIETTDDCDTIARSNYGSTIFLSGIPLEGFINSLSWTALDIEGARPLSYEVYRLTGNRNELIGTLDSLSNTFEDGVDISNPAEASVCYYIIARGQITLANGNVEFIRSRSNTICVEQFSTTYVPNAFAPNGRNQIFKPLIVFSENIIYNMRIFNRWGEKIFESDDPDIGWNGTYKGRGLPEGSYVYLIRIIQPDGREEVKKGSLVLLR